MDHRFENVGFDTSQPFEPGNVEPRVHEKENPSEQVKKKVRPMLDSRKEQLVVKLHDAAGVLRETGEQLKRKNQTKGGEYAATTAQKVEDFTNYLQSKDIDEIVDQVQGFVRQRPWFSIASAFMLGMAAARFIKASNRS